MEAPTNREELIWLRARALFDSDFPPEDHTRMDRAALWLSRHLHFVRRARATLEAEEAAGIMCVPKEPSAAMVDAHNMSGLRADWRAMLKASPFVKKEEK